MGNGSSYFFFPLYKFYTKNRGWIEAQSLTIDDAVMLHGTFAAFVKDIWTEELTESVTVYNFEVAVAHTYFVSKRNVLVHNKCDKFRPYREDYWKNAYSSYKDLPQDTLIKGNININGKYKKRNLYKITSENLDRMKNGKAPIGVDGKSVNLHYPLGRSGDNIKNFYPITRSTHYRYFKQLHPFLGFK